MKRKYTKWDIDKVRKYFEDHDCELLETKYINSKTLMRYECSCGNDDCKIRFEDFKRGQRCIECSGNKKLTLEYVKQYFEDNDCKLIEKEYVNVDTLMEYECKCGNKECKITFSNFKQGRRCNECGIKRTAEKLKYTFKQVKEFFEKEECILKSTVYINANTLLEYICVCERPSKITFSRFRQGQRCRKCAIERNSGENSGSWNPNLTDEDRKKHRDGDPRYYQWRKEVYKRDYYICQVSGKKKGKIVAHHLESYTLNKELRFVVSNGVTMNKDCHIEFHKRYGFGNNTREQFEEFLKDYKEKINILTNILNSVIISQSCKTKQESTKNRILLVER